MSVINRRKCFTIIQALRLLGYKECIPWLASFHMQQSGRLRCGYRTVTGTSRLGEDTGLLVDDVSVLRGRLGAGTAVWCQRQLINLLTPNDDFSDRTAPLTSKRCILYIYSINTGTEYFKHGINSPFLSLLNAVCFIILTYLVPVLFTFYIQSVLNVTFYIFIQQI